MPDLSIRITPNRAIVLRTMLADPKQPQYAHGLCEQLGMPNPTMVQLLHRFEKGGWLRSYTETRGRNQPRRYYTLTAGGLKAAQKELAGWEFTD